MKKTVLILTLLSAFITSFYHLNAEKNTATKDKASGASSPLVDATPALTFNKPTKSAVSDIDVWNLKPFIPIGQMMSLKDMFKPVYTLNKSGRYPYLQRLDRPNEQWQFHGVLTQGKQLRALLYNTGIKRMKVTAVGEKLEENLIVKSVKPDSVIIEAKDDKKPQNFELHIFNTQKDNYAPKRKSL